MNHFEFRSLKDCVTCLRKTYPQREVEYQGTARSTIDPTAPSFQRSFRSPRWLFRGEACLYPTTFSARDRLELAGDDRGQIISLTGWIISSLADPRCVISMPIHNARGLVQHLGLPTEYVDMSADLGVAAAFAVGHYELGVERRGRICVINIDPLLNGSLAHIAKFSKHPWCERARRQAAFGFAFVPSRDLKGCEALRGQVNWFDFPITARDMDCYGPIYLQLMDVSMDPVSGLVRWQINDYVRDRGPLRPKVVEWLAANVPMTPWVELSPTQVADEYEIEVVAPSRLPFWTEEHEKLQSILYWTGERQLPPRSRSEAGNGLMFVPGTYHPITEPSR